MTTPITTPAETLQVGTASAALGERVAGFLQCGEDVAGNTYEIPVHIVRGTKAGPTLWAQGACHGDEYDGTLALLKLLSEINPETLAGSLVAVPAVNIAAFLNGTRASPLDGKDLNRHYPGDANGTYTDRLAHLLHEEVSRVADAFIEHHGGGNSHDVVYYTLYCSNPGPTEQARDMCDAMGAPIVWGSSDEWLKNSLFHRLHGKGIPAVLLECGGEGSLHPQNVQDHYDGLRNLMIHLGMMPGQEPRNVKPVEHRVTQADFFFSQSGGLVELKVRRGDVVEKGQPLATITDLNGHVRETVRSEVERGIILAVRTYGTVPAGGSIALIGRL